jgi:hypothetical protein
LIADIAFIFHWPLAEIERFGLGELAHWHSLALSRWNRANEAPKD